MTISPAQPSSGWLSMVPVTVPVSRQLPVSLLVYGASGTLKFSASAQVRLAGSVDGQLITGSVAALTGIVQRTGMSVLPQSSVPVYRMTISPAQPSSG